MAIQQDVPLAAQVLATIGTICWCVQLLPQIWQNYRRGNCIAFPALTVFIWAISEVPFGAYVIVQDHAMAIQLQPQIFGVLCLVCWGQCLWLSGKCSKLWATFWPFLLAAVMAVGQFLLIWTLRPGFLAGRTMPIKVVWAFAAAGLVVGLIPQYVQQFKRQGRNLGFSWGFLAVDLAGALFSFLAMAVRKQFDVFGGTLYLIVMGMELGFVIWHGYWWFNARGKAKKEGISFGEYVRRLDEDEGIIHWEKTAFWRPLFRSVKKEEHELSQKARSSSEGSTSEGSASVANARDVADVEKNAGTSSRLSPVAERESG